MSMIMQGGEKGGTSYKITCFMELLKAFITEIRMELESSLYCVWLLGYLHFCVAEPARPPLHKMHIMTNMTLMKLYKVQIWAMVHGFRTSRPGITPQ